MGSAGFRDSGSLVDILCKPQYSAIIICTKTMPISQFRVSVGFVDGLGF